MSGSTRNSDKIFLIELVAFRRFRSAVPSSVFGPRSVTVVFFRSIMTGFSFVILVHLKEKSLRKLAQNFTQNQLETLNQFSQTPNHKPRHNTRFHNPFDFRDPSLDPHTPGDRHVLSNHDDFGL